MSTFDFAIPYTKIPHDELLVILNSITEFAFRVDTIDKICVLNSNAYWIKNSKVNGGPYSLTSLKQAVKHLENGSLKRVLKFFGKLLEFL